MVIFCEADSLHLFHLRAVLVWFQAAPGLRINLGKSVLIPVGEVLHAKELVGILDCRLSALPLTYLGLSLDVQFKSSAIWTLMIASLERRLTGWQRLYLSNSGILILLKSTLSNLLTYFLSLFLVPAAIVFQIEKIRHNFL